MRQPKATRNTEGFGNATVPAAVSGGGAGRGFSDGTTSESGHGSGHVDVFGADCVGDVGWGWGNGHGCGDQDGTGQG